MKTLPRKGTKKSGGWVQCPIAHSVECSVWGFWPFGLSHTLSSVVCWGFGLLALGQLAPSVSRMLGMDIPSQGLRTNQPPAWHYRRIRKH